MESKNNPTEKIVQLSEDDILNDFQNIHLRALISAMINIRIYSKMEPNDVAAIKQDKQNQFGQIKIYVKEMLPQEEMIFFKQKRILESIAEVRAELNNQNAQKNPLLESGAQSSPKGS